MSTIILFIKYLFYNLFSMVQYRRILNFQFMKQLRGFSFIDGKSGEGTSENCGYNSREKSYVENIRGYLCLVDGR